jgi:hypothetical protein
MKYSASLWEQYRRSPCYPEECNCEAFSDNIIMQPYASYSNIPMILLGFYIIRHCYRVSPPYLLFGFLVLYTGISSLVLHSTFTFVGTIMDYSGIYMLFIWIFTRTLRLQKVAFNITFFTMAISTVLGLYFYPPIRIPLALTLLYHYHYRLFENDSIQLESLFLQIFYQCFYSINQFICFICG